MFVKDCHSNIKETKGAVTLVFDIINPDTNITEVKGVKALFHVVETLSSEVLLGIDTLRMLGCSIDMKLNKTYILVFVYLVGTGFSMF